MEKRKKKETGKSIEGETSLIEISDLSSKQNQNLVLAQWFAFSLPNPAASGLIPGIPEIFSDKKL